MGHLGALIRKVRRRIGQADSETDILLDVRDAARQLWTAGRGSFPHAETVSESVTVTDGAFTLPTACATVGALKRVIYEDLYDLHVFNSQVDAEQWAVQHGYACYWQGRTITIAGSSVASISTLTVEYEVRPSLPNWIRGLQGDFNLDNTIDLVAGRWEEADTELAGGAIAYEAGGDTYTLTIASADLASNEITVDSVPATATARQFSIFLDGDLPEQLWELMVEATLAVYANGGIGEELERRAREKMGMAPRVEHTYVDPKQMYKAVLTGGNGGGQLYGLWDEGISEKSRQ